MIFISSISSQDIKALQSSQQRTENLRKKFIGSLILYSVVMYILAALVCYFYDFPKSWKAKIVRSIPLLVFPFVWVSTLYLNIHVNQLWCCNKWFEPWENVIVCFDHLGECSLEKDCCWCGDWCFNYLSGSHHQSQGNRCCQSDVLSPVCINWLVSSAVMLLAARLKWHRLVMIGGSWSVSKVRSFCLVHL